MLHAFRIIDVLSGLNDTTVSSPIDGAPLVYDTGTSKWLHNHAMDLGTKNFTTTGTISDGTASLVSGSLTSVKLGSLATNGFVKTSGGIGTLSVDTNTYLTGNQAITLSGNSTGSGATSISVTLDKTAITDRSDVAIVAADVILYSDVDDSNNLKKDTVQGILDLAGAASVAGADTQVQYNNSGAFGADAGFTTDKSGSITLTGTVQGLQLTSTNNIDMAGTLTNTTAAADVRAMTTVMSYTGTAGLVGNSLAITSGAASGLPVTLTGVTSSITDNHDVVFAAGPPATDSLLGYNNTVRRNGDWGGSATVVRETTQAFFNSIGTGARNITATDGGVGVTLDYTTMDNQCFTNSQTFNPGAGKAITQTNIGLDNTVGGSYTVTSGDITILEIGMAVEVGTSGMTGTFTDVTFIGLDLDVNADAKTDNRYGIRMTGWSGSPVTNDYGIYDDTSVAWALKSDAASLFFGNTLDGSIGHSGTIFTVRSDEITSTDSLLLRGGTNGIDFNIGATEQISLTDGVFFPTLDSDVDLGTTGLRWKDAYIDTLTLTTTLTAGGAGTFGGAAAGQSIISSGLVVNEDSGGAAADDFRAETTSNANAFVVDASADEILAGVILKANAGLNTIVSIADVADPPTDANLDAAFGTPAALGAGFVGILDDNSADLDVWLCYTSDTSWFYLQGVKAV